MSQLIHSELAEFLSLGASLLLAEGECSLLKWNFVWFGHCFRLIKQLGESRDVPIENKPEA